MFYLIDSLLRSGSTGLTETAMPPNQSSIVDPEDP
jgi:hypothetical protein